MVLAYAFSHAAAEEEFRAAAAADPSCALAWWGVALVNGPHINATRVPEADGIKALAAVQRARELAANGNTTPVGRALIAALESRYGDPKNWDRKPLDTAYAEAMRRVWEAFPKNADVGALCAESLMDLHPWDLWEKDGKAKPWTPEIVTVLERVLSLNPRHPGALHLYIHLMESSPTPDKAAVAANRLRTLVPDASHLVHMPAHIYARIGRWADAAEANRKAMAADDRYRKAHPAPDSFVLYMAHNTHFLAYTAMMRGRSAEAVEAARRVLRELPRSGEGDGYSATVGEVLMRFGRWEEVLAEPKPGVDEPLSQALWHFTRAVALTASDRLQEAHVEEEAYQKATTRVPSFRFGNNSARAVLRVATRMLSGEMAAKEGRLEEAIATLRQAVEMEDALQYDEPPNWLLPVRHALGAVLLKAGKPGEAESVYREDLRQYPANGWSLQGLTRALSRQGKRREAAAVAVQFRKAWKDADVPIESSCLCIRGE